MSPNKIQPREYSKGSATDDILYFSDGSSWVNPNGNLYVPYLNWNGDEWYLNFNRLDNDWNDNDRLVSCQSLHSLPLRGSFIYTTSSTRLSFCPLLQAE